MNNANPGGADLGLRIEEYSPQELTPQQWESYFALREQRFRALLHDDPLPSRELKKNYMLSPYSFLDTFWWRAYSAKEQKFVGAGGWWCDSQQAPSFEANKHIAYVDIYVDRHYLRRGIGKDFLKAVLTQAQAQGKTLVRAEGVDAEAGMLFCRGLGGKVVSQRHVNRLKMERVDWDLMGKWRKEGAERATGVSVELFQDVPEKDIEQYCQLYTDMSNAAPTGDLAGQQTVTPERRRLTEKEYRDVGYIWHTLISRETDGAISGMTEITYTPQQPHLIEQELTGVRHAYRGRGLGKWLKAAMLFFIRDEYPHAKFVDTGNADHNAPMLAINQRMGFENLLSQTFFEFEMGDLSAKLGI